MGIEQEIDQEVEIEEVEPIEGEAEEVEEPEEIEAEEGQEEASEEEEIVVSIDGDEPEEEEERRGPAPEWVRNLRKEHREQARKIRELEGKLKETAQPEEKPQLPKKPTLEDFDYDTEKFEEALAGWFDKKRAHDAEQEKAKESEKKQAEAWQNKLENYKKSRESLPVEDFEDAESALMSAFNQVQQSIIIKVAQDPATLIYGLGKSSKRLQELAEITDPIEFTARIAKLEDKVIVRKKSAPPPEKTVTGSASKLGATSQTLERLRAEAEKTGDYSKVVAYKNQMRSKA